MDKLNVAIADDNEIMLQMLDHIVSSVSGAAGGWKSWRRRRTD